MLSPVDRLQPCRGCHLSGCHSVVQLSWCRVARESKRERERWRGAAASRPSSTGSPEEKWGALALSRSVPGRSKIGAIGRMLPEYFTDDPLVVKPRRYPWPRYKKPTTGAARRRRPQFLEFVAVLLYSCLYFLRAIALGGTMPRGGLLFKRRTMSLHSHHSRNSPDE